MNNQIVRNQNLKLLAKDLTKDYPRSPRETLAGYVIAARMRLVALRRLFVQILVGVALAPIVSARAPAAQFDQSHALFDKVLKSFVSDARVNYTALKAHPQELEGYLAQVAAVSESDFKGWSEKQQIALLINSYNACTLRLILDHYPLKSIKVIGSFFSGPWNQPVVHLFAETTTLSAVEHKILRKDYSEPRIHFALVCAAKGCPPLRSEAYSANRLDEQLHDQAKQFLATPNQNRVEASERVVYLSPIFKWYAGDFEKKSGSVLAALQTYWSGKATSTDGFKIRYTDYDWTLNDQTHRVVTNH